MNYENMKPREKKIVDTLLALLAERDEGYFNSLKQMDAGFKDTINKVGFSLRVFEELFKELGMTEEKFKEVAAAISGGNDEHVREDIAESGEEDVDSRILENESGSEHFEE